MSTHKTIALLEDSARRVEWLRDHVDSGVRVEAFERVRPFLAFLEGDVDGLVGIVLDHDLGGYRMPLSLQDEDGLTGMDAAHRMLRLDVPILIWSSNAIRPPEMERVLRKRGATQISRVPWDAEGSRGPILTAIRRMTGRRLPAKLGAYEDV